MLNAGICGVALLLLTTGCATRKSDERVLVCPECKIVVATVPGLSGPEGYGSFETYEEEVMRHKCPECQGIIKTFFKTGKLAHQCSICAESLFSCPMQHLNPSAPGSE